jgi:hypothetical protein
VSVPANPDRRVVTVWSDLASPVAALTLHVLRQRAVTRRVPLLVDHRAHPRELLEGSPTPRGVVDGELSVIAARYPELGWRPWPGPGDTYPVTMMLAMEAVQAAKRPEAGGLPASDQLDAELRRAFLAEGRCVSLYGVVAAAARRCPLLDADALLDGIGAGAGRAQVMAQWNVAAGTGIAGSPHLLTAGGFDAVNPVATVRWPGGVGVGAPRLRVHPTTWADLLLDSL